MIYRIIRNLVGSFTVVIYCNQPIDERFLVSSACMLSILILRATTYV